MTPIRPNPKAIAAGVAAAIAAGSLGGCESPLGRESTDDLHRAVDASIERELRDAPAQSPSRTISRPAGDVEAALESRLTELETIGPLLIGSDSTLDYGTDLLGQPQDEVALSLQEAVRIAVENNLGVQFARLQPAISEADVVTAEAAFDAVFFAGAGFSKIDEPNAVPVIGGFPIGTGVNANETARFETGLRRTLTSGGTFSVSTDFSRFRNQTPDFSRSPDPAWDSAIRLGFTQPLLQGFGADVNEAEIFLARNRERRSYQDLRATLLNLAADVEQAYWNLVVARQDLLIRMWLTQAGEKVRDVLDRRRAFDTRSAQYADAVATVERRKAAILEARRGVRAASDRLKALINDPQLTVGSESMIRPIDSMVDEPLTWNLREVLTSAMSRRPEIEAALLSIDDASITSVVADNARLPKLNLDAQLSWFGLNDSLGDSYERLTEGSFIDYVFGVNFEQSIGNRAGEAGFRRSRLERSATVISYRQVVQNVVSDVKSALRDVLTNYELIGATRSTRIAEAENLRSIEVEEETLARLTPEFLNLKFQRQERIALARLDETRALAAYNVAVASLHRAMGSGLEHNNIELRIEDAEQWTNRTVE